MLLYPECAICLVPTESEATAQRVVSDLEAGQAAFLGSNPGFTKLVMLRLLVAHLLKPFHLYSGTFLLSLLSFSLSFLSLVLSTLLALPLFFLRSAGDIS